MRLNRQLNDKFSAVGDVILNTDNAVVIRNYGTDDGKAQTHARFFGRKIGLEQAGFIFIGNSRAIIGHLDSNTL